MKPSRRQCKYQAFYCEENVWHLAGALGGWAVVLSHPSRQTPIWGQRAAEPGEPVLWDYHVVLVAEGEVWDLDTRLAFPAPLDTYFDAAFRLPERVRARVLPAAEYRAGFWSDRGHMRRGGEWLAPPPPWPPILGGAWTLEALLAPAGMVELEEARRRLRRDDA